MEDVPAVLLNQREKLLRFIEKRVSDPDLAEDVLQEGLLKALRSAGQLRDEERLLPWFYRILNNAIIDTYRKQNAETRYLEAYATLSALESELEVETALCECFREILPSLKPQYAELINHFELQTGDPGEFCRQTNILPNTLKVRRHRARQALKQRLEAVCRTCAVHGCLDCTCQQNDKLSS